ncbi:hypothetical protein AGABI2DRAFT_192668 [Agaricus bisporus var. bisporus H97]|uniref:hypothetical protein n=1 Tax=Agaricus bisporus var. bisporus (strain H97 / ATCC MYA-4626 / FGSC 10389) TaxID=936046 RepID=UPI00029F5E74|nr:hypothetical protein AGABI2DRAFT_192668 [Agaricus bisporus var. bisporus H97]EKV47481.1 hypothetical protein AGABI2DRAFT_192668 [Agaricus bisporus var. bisporus H97]
MSSSSPSTNPPSTSRHALTAVEKQRAQLDKLLKDPLKPAYVPPPSKEKTIRPAREMMKNVQGSSAGAGSGEFHVYKASRRREYERLKLMDEQMQKEALTSEFEQKRKQAEDVAEAKTTKNRAKRQKKKERAKRGKSEEDTKQDGTPRESTTSDLPLKKRRLINGKELVFRKPGEESDSEPDEGPQPHETSEVQMPQSTPENAVPVAAAEEAKITIHEDD